MMKKLGQELEIDQIKVQKECQKLFFFKERLRKCKQGYDFTFQEMIKTADLDRDGKISWDEFKKFMQSPNQR